MERDSRFWQNGLGIVLASLLGLSACSLGPETMERLQKIQRKQMMAKNPAAKYLENVTDDARLAYVAMVANQAQIFTIQPDGQKPLQLTNEPGYKTHPAWSLDHKQLAYFRYTSDRPFDEPVAVVVLNDKGESRVVVKDKKIDSRGARLCWKPDGSVLFFQESDFPSILFGYEVATGKPVETIRLPKKTFLTRLYTISPDMLSVAGDGPVGSEKIIHIGTIQLSGKKEMDLMRPFLKESIHTGIPVWSYDSQLVAFELDTTLLVISCALSLNFKVYPISAQEFDAQLSGPAFSPLVNQLACIMEKVKEGNVGSGDQEVTTDVWVMNINGSQQKQITRNGSCFDPCW